MGTHSTFDTIMHAAGYAHETARRALLNQMPAAAEPAGGQGAEPAAAMLAHLLRLSIAHPLMVRQ